MKEKIKLLKTIKNLISEETGVTPKDIVLNSHFEDDLNMGEFEFANLMSAVEDTFSIEVAPEEIGKIKTVQDLLHFIEDAL